MGITDKISHAAERKAFETIPDGKWAHYTQRLIRENDPYILKTGLLYTSLAQQQGPRGARYPDVFGAVHVRPGGGDGAPLSRLHRL